MAMLVRAITLSLLLLPLADSANAQLRGLGRVNGTVVDDAGKPVADVDVQTTAAGGAVISGKSNASGSFSLQGLGRGEWLVLFKKAGFPDKRLKLVIEKELTTSNPVKVTMPKS
jgi:hypothetical protein